MKNLKRIFYSAAGGVLFSLSVNLFLIPASIYNGGFVGISQLLRDLIITVFKLDLNFDIAGLMNFLINVPLLIFAWTRMSKTFVKLSLVSILAQTITVSLVPIPKTPLVEDVFIAILLAAILGSFGASLSYRVKGSTGGLDIIAFNQSRQNKGSLGSVYLAVNAVIYTICFIVYDAQIALYSLIYAAIFSYGMDKFHFNNIEVNVMIFTKNTDIKHQINNIIRRGVTHWDGKGAYTGDTMDVIITIVAQSEVKELRRLCKSMDPKVFIIMNENLKVEGGYEKRLI